MNGAFEVGAAGLRAEQKALEILANNIANINTAGFKRSDAQFSEILAQRVDAEIAEPIATGDISPAAGGVRVTARGTQLSQGAIRPTGNPLDIAIDGQGFIELMGPNGQSLLWRGGRLRVNEDGLLATAAGIPLRATINVPMDLSALTISTDGIVSAETASGERLELGQIGLIRVEREAELERLEDGFLRLVEDARPVDTVAGEDGSGRLVQGGIEESNVALTEEMVQMMIVQRAYAANAQAVQVADQLAAITNNLRQ
ncbi:flagellar hook basal-body protein [Pelagerythrobacter marensis]|uniref:Flagellar basal-body rod protein FlgG n=1 Tax=Pelagerythrobacter marensis TaxID=543877 RepID=A0A0G3XBH2_9SPHN|nr:flagellar hook basal-body protein [Pelagerythrobacter marensis]AKM07959.1 Flagellar basal-body rod protein FlgG [Pelagerythrobacter marensis]